MLNIRELCKNSHEIAKTAGWLNPPPDPEETVNLIVSEFSEALEEYRAHRKLDEVYYEVSYVEALPGTLAKTNVSSTELTAWLASHDVRGEPKPCGIPTELADVVIRIAQYCGSNGLDLATTYSLVKESHAEPDDIATFGRLQYTTTYFVMDSLTSFGKTLDVSALALAVHTVLSFCEARGIDIEAAIKEKEAFNRTRSFRHNGKKI